MEIGDRIRSARERRGITQAELARQLGVSQTQLWKWENNRRRPQLVTLTELSRRLDVSLQHLVTGSEFQASAPPAEKA